MGPILSATADPIERARMKAGERVGFNYTVAPTT